MANEPRKCVTLHRRKEIARTFETPTFVIFHLINQLYCPKETMSLPHEPMSNESSTKLQSDGRLESSSVGDGTLSAENVKSDKHPSSSHCSVKCLLQRLCSLFWPSKCNPAENTHPTAEEQPASESACMTRADRVSGHSEPFIQTARGMIGQKLELHHHGPDNTPQKSHRHPPGRQGASHHRREHPQGREVDSRNSR